MDTPDNTRATPLGVGCTRIFWVLLGPGALALLAVNVATRGGGWLTGLDIAYLVVLAAVLAARWLEFRSGHSRTADGRLLTTAELGRYFVVAASVGLLAWVGANLVGNVWLGR